jgi:glycosyltransferase involved in cell wall biosynthesis
LAYVVSRFPKLTETFVVNEALAMQRLGVEVELFSLMPGIGPALDPRARSLIDRAHFEPFISVDTLKAQVHFLRRDCRKYFRTLFEVLTCSVTSPRFFVGSLVFFFKSVKFAKDMTALRISHIHSQFANHPATAALIISRLTEIPFSFSARGSDIQLDRTMIAEKVRAASIVTCVSEYNRRLILDLCEPDFAHKVQVVYGGVEVERFKPSRKSLRSGTLKILCIGRFEEVKGHTFLIQACSLLRARAVPFETRLIGDGELQATLIKQAQNAGLGDSVRFLGPCSPDQVIAELKRTDVTVLPTAPTRDGKCEGIPNVLKEAMCAAVPVVSSRVPGVQELIENGVSGILVTPKNSTELADALEFLFRNPDVAMQMGHAGRCTILRRFNLQQSVRERYRLFSQHCATAAKKKDGPEGPSCEQEVPLSFRVGPIRPTHVPPGCSRGVGGQT